jgi:hypothetical protein
MVYLLAAAWKERAMAVVFPPFGTFLTALNKASVETGSARGFWGGVTPDGEIVLTTWTDAGLGGDSYKVWRPINSHGGLLEAGREGRIKPGVTVKLIMLHQIGTVQLDQGTRKIRSAGLMPGIWKITRLIEGGAVVEPVRP